MTQHDATGSNAKPAHDPKNVLEFLYRLGQAYLASGEQTAEVERILGSIASAYGMRRTRIVAFPTALFLSVHSGNDEHVTLAEGPTAGLRLDQIAEVYLLGDKALNGEISPRAGIERIQEILKIPPRFGLVGAIGGHAILSVGLATVIAPTATNLIAAAVLGAIVGVLKLLNRNRPSLSVHMPVVASAMVSALVFLGMKWQWPLDPSHVLVPPLVTFLPGARLTLGMVELAYGDMVSGSSRLITGGVQLLLLALGLAAGAMLIGYRPESLVDTPLTPAMSLAAKDAFSIADKVWAPWLGAAIFTLGVYLHFSAPRGSLRWILLVVMVSFSIQRMAVEYFGEAPSGFFGMLVAMPLSYWIQTRFHGPPAMVYLLPSFWILVPGVLSLSGVKQILSDREAGIDGLVIATIAIVSIALGTLTGTSIHKWFHDTARWRRQQRLRVLRWFRGRKRT